MISEIMYFILTPLTQSVLPYVALGLATFFEGLSSAQVDGITISSGFFRPIPVFLAIITYNLLADMVWYSIGRFSKMEWIKKIATRLRINLSTIDDLEYEIQKHSARLLFLAKLTVGLPIPSLIATGLSKVPVRRWIGMLVLGELLKTSVLVSLIFLYASAMKKASEEMQAILLTMTAFVVIAGVIWWKKRKKKVTEFTPE